MVAASIVVLSLIFGEVGDLGASVQNGILGVRIHSTSAEVASRLGAHGTADSRRTRDGGTKQVWTLNGTEFSSIATRLDSNGRVVWITGFARPGHDIPFGAIGDLARARGVSASRVVWDVTAADGGYRLIARGAGGRATTVSLLSLDVSEEVMR